MFGNTFDLLPDSAQPPRRWRFRHMHRIFTTNPCLHAFMFVSIVTLDITEAANDALVYRDVSWLRQGLVYGPLNPTLITIWLLTYSICLLAMVFEVANIVRDLFCGKPWADLDLDSALVVWLGEVPTTAANVAIILCRSELVSYFQLTKSLIFTVSLILRSIVPIIRSYLRTKNNRPIKNPFRKALFRCFTGVGLALAFSGSMSVFIFTHVIAAGDRQMTFRLPHEIWAGNATFEKYFPDVGIYFHQRNLKKAAEDETWIKLADIEELYDAQNLNVKVTFTVLDHIAQKLVINSYNTTSERYRECYRRVQLPDATFHYRLENCTADYITQSMYTEQLIFKFVFVKPQIHLVLGDISFNAKYISDYSCFNISVNDTNLYQIYTDESLLPLGKMIYMKELTKLHAKQRLMDSVTSSGQFTVERVMKAGNDIWKSGIYGCDCTGNDAPSLDKDLQVLC